MSVRWERVQYPLKIIFFAFFFFAAHSKKPTQEAKKPLKQQPVTSQSMSLMYTSTANAERHDSTLTTCNTVKHKETYRNFFYQNAKKQRHAHERSYVHNQRSYAHKQRRQACNSCQK